MSNRAIADAIAKKIMARTQKRFSSLHDEAVREVFMSNSPSPTTTSMNVKDTPASREPLQANAMPNAASEGQQARNAGANGGTINSGLAVNDTQFKVAIPAIQRVKDGTTRSLGDVARSSVDRAADNGGPRNRVGQFDKPSTGAPEKFGSGSGESEYEGTGA